MQCRVFRTSDANPSWTDEDERWAASKAVELNTIEDIVALAKKGGLIKGIERFGYSPIIINDGPYRDGVLLIECYDDHHS